MSYVPLKKRAIGEVRDLSPEYGYRTFPRSDVIADDDSDEKDSDRDNLIGVDVQQDYMTYSPITPMGSLSSIRRIANKLKKKSFMKGEILDRAILRGYLKDYYEFDSGFKEIEDYVRKTIIDSLKDKGLMQHKSEEVLV